AQDTRPRPQYPASSSLCAAATIVELPAVSQEKRGSQHVESAGTKAYKRHVLSDKEGNVDFQYTPEQEAFRVTVRDWLNANLSPDLCVDDARDERIAPKREIFERRRAWQRTMYEAGWVGISWPKQYGGWGADLMEQVIFDEEYN